MDRWNGVDGARIGYRGAQLVGGADAEFPASQGAKPLPPVPAPADEGRTCPLSLADEHEISPANRYEATDGHLYCAPYLKLWLVDHDTSPYTFADMTADRRRLGLIAPAPSAAPAPALGRAGDRALPRLPVLSSGAALYCVIWGTALTMVAAVALSVALNRRRELRDCLGEACPSEPTWLPAVLYAGGSGMAFGAAVIGASVGLHRLGARRAGRAPGELEAGHACVPALVPRAAIEAEIALEVLRQEAAPAHPEAAQAA